ncbi:MAG: hypothetical protein HQK58_03220 [Deltaproteobacteria bacterium]|nr:hypothetical protein [Deltaproteobacteria bacterium]
MIDFIKADRAVLEFVVKHVGPLHVVSPVVDEVNEIDDENELVELGLVIVEPELEDAFAATGQSGPTSFQDRLCLPLIVETKHRRKNVSQPYHAKHAFLW